MVVEHFPSGPELRILPLGGLGEIGLNMMLFEQGEDVVVVDCGLMFPADSMPGVDYVIPDFSPLLPKSSRLRGVVLTHGHEDHIGAIPFLLGQLSVPVYGTPLTLGLVKEKLEEYDLPEPPRLVKVKAGETIRLGGFEIEFIQVSHSIPDPVALAIRTGIGNIIHTGDFKLDPTPIDGRGVDLAAFARYGEEGVMALLSDSTNAERIGYTLSEREVGKALMEIFSEAPGRLIVAMFASNIHRIQQVLDSAARFGRKVAVLGRSMTGNIRIARELGYLTVPAGLVVEPEAAGRLPDPRVVLLTTGTQGEPLSGLVRMAKGEHKQVQIRPGDTVVLSSRFIPGNERAIDYLINEFYRRGAEVIYEKVSEIHVSGHASQEELKLMISLTRPRYFIPVHGEYRHLVKHAQVAMMMGLPAEHVLIAEDGDLISFTEVGHEYVGRIEVGQQVVDGPAIAAADDVVLAERRKLAQEGVLVVVAVLDRGKGELMAPLRLKGSGFLFEEEAETMLEDARLWTEQEIMALPEARRKDKKLLAQDLAVFLRKYIKKNMLRFPVILPLVIDL